MAEQKPTGKLEILDSSEEYEFDLPSKRINDGEDVTFWLQTHAYTDIMTFLLQLNAAMFPRKLPDSQKIQTWELDAQNVQFSPTVLSLRALLQKLDKVIDEAPPDPGPRRFGNMSFRKWYQIVEERIDQLLEEHIPRQVLDFGHWTKIAENLPPKTEFKKYLLGSFGSAQRLDYGTGHELSFLAFIGCIWKLNGFDAHSEPWGTEERGIVLGVIEPYLHLIRKLILTYTLEPAGSHGVWGLDDHSFLPYIFGSAQLGPAINLPADIPQEGSAPDAPKPGDIAKSMTVERERKKNMYFSAIGFINDVKKGPFWEHSPILFDISGITAGWAKINKVSLYNTAMKESCPS
jgi:serine/threonine-protein phosphatase 2A activator